MTTDPTDLPAEKVAALAEALWAREYRAAAQLADEPTEVQEGFRQDAAALAPLIARWLGEAEAAAWAGAADDEGDPGCVPTAGQLLRRMANATEDERLAFAERAIVNSEKGHKCFIENHRGRIGHLERERAELLDRLEAAEAAVERVRASVNAIARAASVVPSEAQADALRASVIELRGALDGGA